MGASIAGIINPCSRSASWSSATRPTAPRTSRPSSHDRHHDRHLPDGSSGHAAVQHPRGHRGGHRERDHGDRQHGKVAERLGVAEKTSHPEVDEIAHREPHAHWDAHLEVVNNEPACPPEPLSVASCEGGLHGVSFSDALVDTHDRWHSEAASTSVYSRSHLSRAALAGTGRRASRGHVAAGFEQAKRS